MCVYFLRHWSSLITPDRLMYCVINHAPCGFQQDLALRYYNIKHSISNCALVVTSSASSWGRGAAHDFPLISTRACLVRQPRVIILAIKTALWGAALLRAQDRVPSELPVTQNQQIKQYGVILNFSCLSEQCSPPHTTSRKVCKHRQIKQPLKRDILLN